MRIILVTMLILFASSVSAADIFSAARSGDAEFVAQYIERGGDVNQVNSKSYTPFILAAYYNQVGIMQQLSDAGADFCALDEKGSNAFMGVAFRGHTEAALWLLETADCGVNQQNYAGQTALMMASLFGREQIIKLLLEHGADPEISDYQGYTAERLAAAQGLDWVVKTLRFHFAD